MGVSSMPPTASSSGSSSHSASPSSNSSSSSPTVPLLDGLVASGRAVETMRAALSRQRHWECLQRALRRWIQRHRESRPAEAVTPRPRKQARLHPPSSVRQTSATLTASTSSISSLPEAPSVRSTLEWTTTTSPSTSLLPTPWPRSPAVTQHHWLWRALVSSSPGERRAAARLWVHAVTEEPPLLTSSIPPLVQLLQQQQQQQQHHPQQALPAAAVRQLVALVHYGMDRATLSLAQQEAVALDLATIVARVATGGRTSTSREDGRAALLDGVVRLLHHWLLTAPSAESSTTDTKTSSKSSSTTKSESDQDLHFHIWNVPEMGESSSTHQHARSSHQIPKDHYATTSWSPLAALLQATAATQADSAASLSAATNGAGSKAGLSSGRGSKPLSGSSSSSNNNNSSSASTAAGASSAHRTLELLSQLIDPAQPRRPRPPSATATTDNPQQKSSSPKKASTSSPAATTTTPRSKPRSGRKSASKKGKEHRGSGVSGAATLPPLSALLHRLSEEEGEEEEDEHHDPHHGEEEDDDDYENDMEEVLLGNEEDDDDDPMETEGGTSVKVNAAGPRVGEDGDEQAAKPAGNDAEGDEGGTKANETACRCSPGEPDDDDDDDDEEEDDDDDDDELVSQINSANRAAKSDEDHGANDEGNNHQEDAVMAEVDDVEEEGEEDEEEEAEQMEENHGDEDDCDDDDDDDDEEDDDDDDDDEEEEDAEEHDDDDPMQVDLPGLLERHAARSRSISGQSSGVSKTDGSNSTSGSGTASALALHPPLADRQKALVGATMQVLQRQYQVQRKLSPTQSNSLSVAAEQNLWQSVNLIIEPPKKPVTTKIILRRAPTQEEFFRGSLSRNPVAMDSIRSEQDEPTVGDLRQHIANDLQMGDSAELIEIVIANKIVQVNLKLRVIHQVLWRRHLIENTTTGSSGSGHSFLSMGSGLSMIFTSGFRSTSGRSSGGPITAETPASHLPPMIATYRLAGVDGEATEDVVSELVDPEAPIEGDAASPEEKERLLEEKYGLTKLILSDRRHPQQLFSSGVGILLRSVRRALHDVLRRVRRDDVLLQHDRAPDFHARSIFLESPPCPGLVLLRFAARLAVNRRLLLQHRAPTTLLTLLLDVLKAVEGPVTGSGNSKSNPTADLLQELIESLTSDIHEVETLTSSSSTAADTTHGTTQDASSMPLLLESIETMSLQAAPLRNVIAKLLPFLTYGQADLSQTLASRFDRHIDVDALTEKSGSTDQRQRVLMNTFVETAISLPANEVCNSLRSELISCGFVDKLIVFIMKEMPAAPPSWSLALWPKNQTPSKTEDSWRTYVSRDGVRTAFRIVTGLCRCNPPTQARMATFHRFVQCCHWLEATSDSTTHMVSMDGLGLLAETLLDELVQGNAQVKKAVDGVRKKTRQRKKELAQDRRNKALGNFGTTSALLSKDSSRGTTNLAVTGTSQAGQNTTGSTSAAKKGSKKAAAKHEKPAWLAEMEEMAEETGLTCAVCQEGRTLQPSELLGLYAFVRKVAIPLDQCGARASIDGSALLGTLATALPDTSKVATSEKSFQEWYLIGRAAGEDLSPTTSVCVSSGGRRSSVFTTTVSAGNPIHMSCHMRARTVDRNHPKAPKSEWEGAKLRNGRVDCNIILPLVSSRTSEVSLAAVDQALSEHQSAISNLLGTTPRSMLWTTLYDVRFLLLRMAYGESLNAECGGGSLVSNCQLLFYQMATAEMFEKDAQVDQPDQSQHARGLSAGFLAACSVLNVDIGDGDPGALARGIADAAPMACLTCILFHNNCQDLGAAQEGSEDKPHPKRQWVSGREHFLKGLIICAGRRHSLSIDSSGCLSNRGSRKRMRASSFADWDSEEKGDASSSSSSQPGLSDFRNSLRPMITFFIMMDQLSSDYAPSMDDSRIRECADRMVNTVEKSLRCGDIHELLHLTKSSLTAEEVLQLLQGGMSGGQSFSC